MIPLRVFGRQFSSRANNPTLKALGITDRSAFHVLPPSTRQELVAMYQSGLITHIELGEVSLSKLQHFEEAAATSLIARFRAHTKIPRLEMSRRGKYFAGFIKKERESAQGLKEPPKELNSAAFNTPTKPLNNRQQFLEQQAFKVEIKKELDFLESPMASSLAVEELQARYTALFYRSCTFAKGGFVPPHRVAPAESVFKSFVKHGKPDRAVCETMLSLYSRAFQPGNAMNTYRIMTALDYEGDISVFNALLSSCTKSGKDDWKLVVVEMEANEVEPDGQSFEHLIEACGTSGEHLRALEFYAEAQRRQLNLGYTAAHTLLSIFQSLNLRPQGEEQFKKIRSEDMQVADLGNILLLRLRANDLPACLELRDVAMQQKSADMCSFIVKSYVETGHSEEAKDFFASLPSDMVNERALLLVFREYRKANDMAGMSRIFAKTQDCPEKYCKAIYLGYLHALAQHLRFSEMPKVWQEFEERVARILAEAKALEDWDKSDRLGWVAWMKAPENPLQDPQTMTSLVHIVAGQLPWGCTVPLWESEALPFFLSVLDKAGRLQPRPPELLAVLQSAVKFVLKLPGFSQTNAAVVQARAQSIGLS